MVVDGRIKVYPVSATLFRASLEGARFASTLVAEMTSDPASLPDAATYYLTEDLVSGFGVTDDGELVGVFSLRRGRGDLLVHHATVFAGARRLDCFDGYLPELYARHGFVEAYREANWTAGGPDVVFMVRP